MEGGSFTKQNQPHSDPQEHVRGDRVEGGSFTLQPSQIPAGYSRITGLLFHQPTAEPASSAKIALHLLLQMFSAICRPCAYYPLSS